MSDSLFASPRLFRVWLYTVSHSTLLLRSLKTPHDATRIDLIFKPVRAMHLSTNIFGIDVRRGSSLRAKGALASAVAACDPQDSVFVLSEENGGAWVVSGTMAWHEDDGDDSDPSYFDVPRMVW